MIAQIGWFAAVLALLALEVFTPGALVSIWFAAGAVAALLVSLFCPVFWVQLLVFLAVSIAALLSLRPLVNKHLHREFTPTNADSVIGMQACVLEEIRPNIPGRVRANGLDWAAKAEETFPVGAWCTVESIAGATLHVVKTAEPAVQAGETDSPV